jgi:hypothetical protein
MTDLEREYAFRNRLLAQLKVTEHPDVGRLGLDRNSDRFVDVWLHGDGEYTPPRFRVYHSGAFEITSAVEAGGVAAEPFAEVAAEKVTVCPVLLAVFSQTDRQGWVTWVTKPAGNRRRAGGLETLPAPHLRAFDRAALDDIVSVARAWRPAVTAGKRA